MTVPASKMESLFEAAASAFSCCDRLVARDIRLPGQAFKIQGELVDLGGQVRGRQAGEFLVALYGLLLRHAPVRVHRDDRHGKEDDRGRDEGPGENPSSQRAAREESSHAAT